MLITEHLCYFLLVNRPLGPSQSCPLAPPPLPTLHMRPPPKAQPASPSLQHSLRDPTDSGVGKAVTVVSAWSKEFILVSLFINYCFIFHTNNCSPTFAPPCNVSPSKPCLWFQSRSWAPRPLIQTLRYWTLLGYPSGTCLKTSTRPNNLIFYPSGAEVINLGAAVRCWITSIVLILG